jgi:predicted Zn-dependent protease
MPTVRTPRLTSALILLLTLISGAAAPARAIEDLKLPNLGESSTSLFSAEYEYQLGRTWLRMFRGQVPTVNDPLLFDYLEGLIFDLVNHSQLKDRRVDLVVVDNAAINAFAVPGGVIGVHNGLLLYAQTEDELATVLAHEIAHLSQRHFSRRVEFQKKQQPLTLASMIAGLALMAAAGGDAGIAALSAAQAAAQDSALRYSRSNEAEADRVAMQTLVAAGRNPHAAPSMFERMLQASRYATGQRVPEFLRTHPLSENRIADTRNRARQYPKKIQAPDLKYQLMRARVVNQLADTPEEAIGKFRSELTGSPQSTTAARYGLVLALTDAGRPDEAALELDGIWAGRKSISPATNRNKQWTRWKDACSCPPALTRWSWPTPAPCCATNRRTSLKRCCWSRASAGPTTPTCGTSWQKCRASRATSSACIRHAPSTSSSTESSTRRKNSCATRYGTCAPTTPGAHGSTNACGTSPNSGSEWNPERA